MKWWFQAPKMIDWEEREVGLYLSGHMCPASMLRVKAKTVHDAWDSTLYFLDKINTKAWTRLALIVPRDPLEASRMACTAAINNFWHFCIPISPFLVASLSWFHTALFVLGTAKSLQFPGLRYFSLNPSIFSLGSLLLIRPSTIFSSIWILCDVRTYEWNEEVIIAVMIAI